MAEVLCLPHVSFSSRLQWKNFGEKLDLIHQCFLKARKIGSPGKPEDCNDTICCNVRLSGQFFPHKEVIFHWEESLYVKV